MSAYDLPMSKSRLAFLPLLLLLVLPGIRPLAAQEVKTPAALHSLWKVQGASNVVYLLGSVHLLKENDYPLAAD